MLRRVYRERRQRVVCLPDGSQPFLATPALVEQQQSPTVMYVCIRCINGGGSTDWSGHPSLSLASRVGGVVCKEGVLMVLLSLPRRLCC